LKYSLLVVDVDGTLVNSQGEISSEDKIGINKAKRKGIIVALSTGRVIAACQRILGELDLDGHHIFCDGGLIYNPTTHHEVKAFPHDPGLVREAIDFCIQHNINLEVYSKDDFFMEREAWFGDIHRKFFNVSPIIGPFGDIEMRERVLKLEIVVQSEAEKKKASNFRQFFEGRLIFSTARTPAYPGVEFINILPQKVSKGTALRQLAAYLGIPLGKVFAIGDGTNDITLVEEAGFGVAMGNARPELKKKADYVTTSIWDNGVAMAIERFLL
jgi:Cof subfamily protein (haloacid dehalogenase superfamily)